MLGASWIARNKAKISIGSVKGCDRTEFPDTYDLGGTTEKEDASEDHARNGVCD